jgi:hypothetical protein
MSVHWEMIDRVLFLCVLLQEQVEFGLTLKKHKDVFQELKKENEKKFSKAKTILVKMIKLNDEP